MPLLSSLSSKMQTILSSNCHEISKDLPGQNLFQHHYYKNIFIECMEVYSYPESCSHVIYKELTCSTFPSIVFWKLILPNEKVPIKCQPHFRYWTSAPCTLQTLFLKIRGETIMYKSLLQRFDTTLQWKGTSGSPNERIWSLDTHNCLFRSQRKKENWWAKR